MKSVQLRSEQGIYHFLVIENIVSVVGFGWFAVKITDEKAYGRLVPVHLNVGLNSWSVRRGNTCKETHNLKKRLSVKNNQVYILILYTLSLEKYGK